MPHGWDGDPPGDDDGARGPIIDPAMRCIGTAETHLDRLATHAAESTASAMR